MLMVVSLKELSFAGKKKLFQVVKKSTSALNKDLIQC